MPYGTQGTREVRLVEPGPGSGREVAADRRRQALERLVAAIEDELSDDGIDDHQRLQNIGERVASTQDGR